MNVLRPKPLAVGEVASARGAIGSPARGPLQAMLDRSPRVRQLERMQRAIGGAEVAQRQIVIGDPPDGSYFNGFSPDQAVTVLSKRLETAGIDEPLARRILGRFADTDVHFDEWDDVVAYLEDPTNGYDAVINRDSVYVESGSRKGEDKQRNRATKLMDLIHETFGVDFDSSSGNQTLAASLEENRDELPAAQYRQGLANLKQVRTASWEIGDLEALYQALTRFRPILGSRRASSPRAAVPQEITTFGKVNRDVTMGGSLAETFQSSQSILMYEDGVNATGDAPSQEDKLTTFVHELTHGLLEHRIAEFQDLEYWQQASGDEDFDIDEFEGEKPPNDVAIQSEFEDMAESVAMFLSTRESRRALEQGWPDRFAAVSRILEQEFGEIPGTR